MKISIIAAMTDDGVIGIENRLPWDLPADMKWFRQQTLGKPVLMGRKTYDSIGKPLPGRRNIVISRDSTLILEGCEVVNTIETALERCSTVDEVMIIGGASFYQQTLPQADQLYLTLVHANIKGDAYFPPLNLTEWHEIVRIDHPADAQNCFSYSFTVLERKR